MASVIKRGERWYARYRDHTGKKQSKVVPARREAEALKIAHDLERRAERQRLGLEAAPAADGGGTVRELLDWWLDHHSKKLASHEKNSNAITRHLAASPLAVLRLTETRREHIEAFLDAKDAELGQQSVNHLRAFLSRAFNSAIRLGRFAGPNPVAAVTKRKIPKRVPDFLRPDEVPSVLAAVNPCWRLLFATAIYSGLRKGELFALRKRDVDLVANTITVAASHGRDTTKGGHADAIPMATELRPFLEQAIARSSSELVFPDPDGNAWREDTDLPNVLRSALARAEIVIGWDHRCRRKGCAHRENAPDKAQRRCPRCNMKLWPKAKVRPIRFHDLRHTTASILMMRGASPAAVQRILRHADIKTTVETYSHLSPDWLRSEIDRFNLLPDGFELMPVDGEGVTQCHALPGTAVSTEEEANAEPMARVAGDARSPNRVQPHVDVPNARLALHENSNENQGLDWRAVQESNLRPSASESVHGTVRNVSVRTKAQRNHGASEPAQSVPYRSLTTFGGSWSPNRVQGQARLSAIDGGARNLLSVRQVAERLGIKPVTVYRLCDRGQLPFVRVSNALRIDPRDLERFVKNNKGPNRSDE